MAAAAMEREKKALADRVEDSRQRSSSARRRTRPRSNGSGTSRVSRTCGWRRRTSPAASKSTASGTRLRLERVARCRTTRGQATKQQADDAKAVANGRETHARVCVCGADERGGRDSAHESTAHRKISQILDFARATDELRLGKEDEAHEDGGTEGDEGRGDSSSLEVQQQHRLWQRIKSSMHTDADEAELDERLRLIDVIVARERRVAQLEEIRKRAEAAEAARRNELASEKVQLSEHDEEGG